MNTPHNEENNAESAKNNTESAESAETQQRKKRPPKLSNRSAMNYLAVLFGAAFCLLLLTYLMEQRQNQTVIDGLTQSITGLERSASTMQSVDALYETNASLVESVTALESELDAMEKSLSELQTTLALSVLEKQSLRKSQSAMDWFWQINEAFVRNRYATARTLIEEMEALDLVGALPTESVTDNKRFSPADRYEEIYNSLY